MLAQKAGALEFFIFSCLAMSTLDSEKQLLKTHMSHMVYHVLAIQQKHMRMHKHMRMPMQSSRHLTPRNWCRNR